MENFTELTNEKEEEEEGNNFAEGRQIHGAQALSFSLLSLSCKEDTESHTRHLLQSS